MYLKKRIHNILLASKKPGDLSWWFDSFIITLIILNVIAMLLESVRPIRMEYGRFFYFFELFSVLIFR